MDQIHPEPSRSTGSAFFKLVKAARTYSSSLKDSNGYSTGMENKRRFAGTPDISRHIKRGVGAADLMLMRFVPGRDRVVFLQ